LWYKNDLSISIYPQKIKKRERKKEKYLYECYHKGIYGTNKRNYGRTFVQAVDDEQTFLYEESGMGASSNDATA
jgi:hypothetical protein